MNNCPYDLGIFCPSCKGKPECMAIERHHIIPRGHMPGELAENWELNKVSMRKSCHNNYLYIGHRKLWEVKRYCLKELRLLALLGRLPYYPQAYPLIGERARWALNKLKNNDLFVKGNPSQAAVKTEISRLAWGILDVPVWIERAFEK